MATLNRVSPRIDAARNRRALLDSAARLFSEHGAGVALEPIALDAGVSIATLYRNFASREELLTATFQREIDHLGDVEPLLQESDAASALSHWVSRFVEYGRTKRAMADVLQALPATQRPTARTTVTNALDRILAAGAADGTLRTDLDAVDVLAALAGLWSLPDTADRDERAERLGRFVVAGLSWPGKDEGSE